MKPIDTEPLYRNGLHYDLQNQNFDSDIPFYINQAKKYGEPVLELACGTGRITIPMAEQGYDITGLDISNGMLNQARKKAAQKNIKIDFIYADARNFKLDKKFNLIFIPFNSIAHIHTLEDFESLCSCVKEHLTHEGRFIIDMFNPNIARIIRPPLDKADYEYPNPYGDGTVEIWETSQYNSALQINYIKWKYVINGKEEFTNELNMRIYYPQEMDALVKYNGFILEKKYGDFDESDFISESPKQLLICKKL